MLIRLLTESTMPAILGVLSAGMLAAGNGSGAGLPHRIRFVRYPRLKLGFCTQNFLGSHGVSVESAEKLIEYADKQGYHWIELRDPDASLTVGQCKKINEVAKHHRVEVGYAMQRGLLDADFLEVYQRAVGNAAVFTGPGTIRVLLSGQNFADPKKKGMTGDELDQSVAMADEASKLACDHKLQLVVENSSEPLLADEVHTFGLTDFFQRTDSEVGWMMDTGNFFAGARDNPTADQVEEFLNLHADNLFYAHIKSVKDGDVPGVLGDNPLGFETIFEVLAGCRVQYVTLELPGGPDGQKNCQNLEESLKYLKKKGMIE